MKILVAIAHHGTKNRPFLERLLDTYAQMPFEIDVVVLTEVPKSFAQDVEVRVGLPTRDPWSLPFGHRRLFAERRDAYDLFVYSEDDTLVSERNLRAYLEESGRVRDDELPGFVRFEATAEGRRFFPDSHSGYHWRPASIDQRDTGLYASYSNEHSACYVLTREQLARCLASGGFALKPHEGRYDMLVSAATDPYVHCGYRKIVPIDRIDDFLVHHLPNVYIGRFGIFEDEFAVELDALAKEAARSGDPSRLLDPEKHLNVGFWDKSFREPLPPPLAQVEDMAGSSLLIVGVGGGEIETHYLDRGAVVYGIPLDSVAAEVAASKGVICVPVELDEAVDQLQGASLDAALLVDVLPHLPDPVQALRAIRTCLRSGAVVTATARNLTFERLGWLGGRRPKPPARHGFDRTRIWPADRRRLIGWMSDAGLRPDSAEYWSTGRDPARSAFNASLFAAWTNDRILVQASVVR